MGVGLALNRIKGETRSTSLIQSTLNLGALLLLYHCHLLQTSKRLLHYCDSTMFKHLSLKSGGDTGITNTHLTIHTNMSVCINTERQTDFHMHKHIY